MKLMKENMTLVICGAVIVVALVFAFVPGVPFMAPALQGGIQGDITERYAKAAAVQDLMKTTLSLPNWPEGKGVPPQGWIDARTGLIVDMKKQQEQVDADARRLNMINRYDERAKAPLLPLPGGAKAMPRYLPTVAGDPMAFKELMGTMQRQWRALLATDAAGELDADKTVPPPADAIKAKLEQKNQPGAGVGSMAGAGMSQAQQTEVLWRLEKQEVTARALELRMYVEPTAFQARPWFVGTQSPEDFQIFEGFVESWFQSDVVQAIAAVNKDALASVTPKNVGKAAVKRLTRMVVGTGARVRALGTVTAAGGGPGGNVVATVDPGQIFLTADNANSAAGGGGAVPSNMTPVPVNGGAGGGGATAQDAPAPANTIRPELGMTGRAAGADYDVVPMSIIMDIDPAYLNKFIDQLYKRNMSYTVTNLQFKTVDPLDRASHGYLYGDGTVIEVEIQLEGILFRSWTQPLMPKQIKQNLGIAPKV